MVVAVVAVAKLGKAMVVVVETEVAMKAGRKAGPRVAVAMVAVLVVAMAAQMVEAARAVRGEVEREREWREVVRVAVMAVVEMVVVV